MFPGAQVTLASVSVPAYYMPLRIAGAQARKVLLDNVAEQWNVPVEELTTDRAWSSTPSRTAASPTATSRSSPRCRPSCRRSPRPISRSREQFKLIGRKDIGRVDVPSKVNGTAKYGIDVQVPGMVYASRAASRRWTAPRPKRQRRRRQEDQGRDAVLPLPFGVAVIGDTVEATRAGRNAAQGQVGHDGSPGGPVQFREGQGGIRPQGQGPGRRGEGGVQGRRCRQGARRRGQGAGGDLLVRAHLSRPDGADERRRQVSEDGQSVEIWVGTQVQPLAAAVVAGVLKTTPDKIKINLQLLGGGFGRRIWPDAPVQAAVISNIVKKPVKLIAHARGRHRGRAAAADDASRAQGRARRQEQSGRLAPPHRRRERRRGCRSAALRGDRRQGLHRLAGMSRSSTRSRTSRPKASASSAACAFTPGAASARATTSSRASPSWTRSRRRRASTRSPIRLELTKDHPRAQAVIKAVAEMADWSRSGQAAAWASRSPTITTRSPPGSPRFRSTGDRQDQGPQLLDRGRSGPRHPARQRACAARKRHRLWL